jgi:hypothetical protein
MRVGDFKETPVTSRLSELLFGPEIIGPDRGGSEIHSIKVHEGRTDGKKQHVNHEQQHDGVHDPLPILLAGDKKSHD